MGHSGCRSSPRWKTKEQESGSCLHSMPWYRAKLWEGFMWLTNRVRIGLRRICLASSMTLLLLSILSSSVQAQDFTILPVARFEDPAPNGERFDSTHALSVNDN